MCAAFSQRITHTLPWLISLQNAECCTLHSNKKIIYYHLLSLTLTFLLFGPACLSIHLSTTLTVLSNPLYGLSTSLANYISAHCFLTFFFFLMTLPPLMSSYFFLKVCHILAYIMLYFSYISEW